jgi:hypothetical protein
MKENLYVLFLILLFVAIVGFFEEGYINGLFGFFASMAIISLFLTRKRKH